jgi:3-dehydroquinate synthase
MNRNIILIGFMAAGKDTVGREVGRRSGRAFLSLDRLIELRTGQTIPDIFRRSGETGFRKIEKAALASIRNLKNIVLATGGGTPLDPQNRRRMKRTGYVVHLRTEWAVLEKRLERNRTRPLARDKARLRRIFSARRAIYDFCDRAIDTGSHTPGRIADQIIARAGGRERPAPPAARIIKLRGSDRTCPVVVGSGIFSRPGILSPFLRGLNRGVIVTNPVVAALYLDRTCAFFRGRGIEVRPYILPDGERAKDLETVRRFYDFLIQGGYTRSDCLIGLGGGVITDLTGFTAATYKRGMKLVHLPTTLLAQVDAAVGGKCGVNHAGGKNLIGAFYQPDLVVCDTERLLSLPDAEFRNGLAEVVKCGFIGRASLFARLEAAPDAALERGPGILNGMVAECVDLKRRIVERDEREEKGGREILNFGHTVGHALERLAGYGRIGHGPAVAIGMVWEARRSVRLGKLPARARKRLERLLNLLGLPTALPPGTSSAALRRHIRQDKKIRRGKLRAPVPRGIGKISIKEVKWQNFL